jgi:hypothetical protein
MTIKELLNNNISSRFDRGEEKEIFSYIITIEDQGLVFHPDRMQSVSLEDVIEAVDDAYQSFRRRETVALDRALANNAMITGIQFPRLRYASSYKAEIDSLINDFIVMQYRIASIRVIKYPQYKCSEIKRLEKSVLQALAVKAFIAGHDALSKELVCGLIGVTYQIKVLNLIFEAASDEEWDAKYILGSSSETLYASEYVATDYSMLSEDFGLELHRIANMMHDYRFTLDRFKPEIIECLDLVARAADQDGITKILPASVIRRIKQSYQDVYGGDINALCN